MLPEHYNLYHEPFVGGGALLFHMLKHTNLRVYSMSDINEDLIITYNVVRRNVDELIEILKVHDHEYRKDAKPYYYHIRGQSPRGDVARAARLLFLNKTCFNGLYRVNSSGAFNVPMGSYKNPNIVNEDALRLASDVLQNNYMTIRCLDFEFALRIARHGDLVYLDPPYHPVNGKGNFTGYTSGGFTTADLEKLAATCDKLDREGCYIMMSNSNADEVKELFDREPYVIHEVTAARSINSDGKNRTGHREVIITNYEVPDTNVYNTTLRVAEQ